MTDYQISILKAEEDFLKRESSRYNMQRHRLESWSKFRKFILGKVYEDLLSDCDELHKLNRENIVKIAELMGVLPWE